MNKISKDSLYNLYIIEKKSMREVAKELGVAVGSVYNYLNRYGISSRKNQGMTGKHHSQVSRDKISKGNKGKVVSKETKEKMAEAKRIGGVGHKKLRADGYIAIYFPDHPRSNRDGYIMEHDLVMECIIGRPLGEDEVVHHINHVRTDNKKENLQLLTIREHASLHMKDRWQKKKGGMTY